MHWLWGSYGNLDNPLESNMTLRNRKCCAESRKGFHQRSSLIVQVFILKKIREVVQREVRA